MPKNQSSVSQSISDFSSAVTEIQKEYKRNLDKIVACDQLTQDYLHKLELDHLLYGDRAKIATQLAECRRQRRHAKDMVALAEPVISLLEEPESQHFMKMLKQVLGKVRKIENNQSARMYTNRVLVEVNIPTKGEK